MVAWLFVAVFAAAVLQAIEEREDAEYYESRR